MFIRNAIILWNEFIYQGTLENWPHCHFPKCPIKWFHLINQSQVLQTNDTSANPLNALHCFRRDIIQSVRQKKSTVKAMFSYDGWVKLHKSNYGNSPAQFYCSNPIQRPLWVCILREGALFRTKSVVQPCSAEISLLNSLATLLFLSPFMWK